MVNIKRPIILVSKCLGFGACRYDGQIKSDPFVEVLKQYLEFIPICPEVSIGLGIPRKPIQVEKHSTGLKLIQPETEIDLTNIMDKFCEEFMEESNIFHGAILKGKSPSCGVMDTIIYSKDGKEVLTYNDYGFFSRALKNKFPDIPIESIERLQDKCIREHFLQKIFTLANCPIPSELIL